MTRLVTSLGVLLMLTTFANGQEEEVGRIIAALDAATRNIKCYDVYADFTITHRIIDEPAKVKAKDSALAPSGPESLKAMIANSTQRLAKPGEVVQTKESYRARYDDATKRGRTDVLAINKPEFQKIYGYSPSVERVYSPRARTGSINEPALTPFPDGAEYRAAYRNFMGRIDIVNCLRERATVIATGFPKNYIGLDAPPVGKPELGAFPTWGFRVAIDPARGGLPAIMELYEKSDRAEGVLLRREVRDWKQLSPQIWVPTRIVTSHYVTLKRDPLFGELADESTLVVDTSRSTWNVPLAASDLYVPFPTGTQVVNFPRKQSYITGDSDPGEHLDHLSDKAKRVIPINTEQLLEGNVPETSRRLWWYALAAGGGVIGLIALVLRRRIWK